MLHSSEYSIKKIKNQKKKQKIILATKIITNCKMHTQNT